jgi:hypothetical protein
VPAYVYLAAWFVLARIVFVTFGMETKGQSPEAIEDALGQPGGAVKESSAIVPLVSFDRSTKR